MPLLGLLSDSHGRTAQTRAAVALLLEHGAQRLLHLGDVGSTGVLDELVAAAPGSDQALPVGVVFGNNDDPGELGSYARSLGIIVAHPAGRLFLPRGELVYTHGDSGEIMAIALRRQVRYLCHGHTHVAADRHEGATRIINPGALHRAARHTVALLDTESDQLTFYPVGVRC